MSYCAICRAPLQERSNTLISKTLKDLSDSLKVSVIIPVYNGGEKLKQCIAALVETKPPPAEVILVRDGTDEDLSYAEKSLTARIFTNAQQSGPAVARNRGAREAKGDIFFFLDADVVPNADAVKQVTDGFREHPEIGALFGSYDDAPAESNFQSQYRNLLHHYVHQTGKTDASTFWSGCGAIRKEAFEAVGGFDEVLFSKPSIEDIELGYRLRQAGYPIRLCKTLQVKHLKHWDLPSILKTDFFQRALPWTRLIHRDKRLLNDLNTDTRSRLSVIVAYSIVLTLLLAFFNPAFLLLTLLLGGLLIMLNRSLYGFFKQKRGWGFTLKAILMHGLYYLYSGLAFFIGTLKHLLNR